MPKSATEKRDQVMEPRVEVLRSAKGANYPRGRMLISTPREIDAVVRGVRKGQVLPAGELRDRLARTHNADYTCTLTTGIFLRIVAEAAEEERALGKARVTPWWRVVRDDGSLNDKMPGGVDGHARHLREEGIALERKGKANWRVAGLT